MDTARNTSPTRAAAPPSTATLKSAHWLASYAVTSRSRRGLVGAQQAVGDPVAPGAVPPADAPGHALAGESGLLQRPLLGHVAHLGGGLDPVRGRVREQVARQQAVR